MIECPNCEKVFRGRKCRTCGWSPIQQPIAGAPLDARCSYLTDGQRCFMNGEFQDAPNRLLYCGWHSHPRYRGSRDLTSFEDFEAWVLWNRKYCGQWSHLPVVALWEAVRGVAFPKQPRQHCEAGGCPWRPMLKPGQRERRDVAELFPVLLNRPD